MKYAVIGLVVVLIVLLVTSVSGQIATPAPTLEAPPIEKPEAPSLLPDGSLPQVLLATNEPSPTPTDPTPVDEALIAAFEAEAEQQQQNVLGLMMYDPVVNHIQYSADGATALLWIALRDPQTGEVIAAEPGLSIARNESLANPQLAASWDVTLPSTSNWADQISTLPADLLTDDLRARYLTGDPDATLLAAAPFTGYKLPWTAGVSKRLSGSIGHFLIYNSCSETSCRYAYDYADGTMFPLLASKGGTVKAYKITCANYATDCTNFLVLEDNSTIPTTYQLYYHLAYNSIPTKLRVIGTPVRQGEYIGDVDDTGYSTGHHLHFHVYTTKVYLDWSWGYSVNFIYDDVAINGGYPRTCYEATTWPGYGTECNPGKDGKRGTSDDDQFVSGNTPANPPVGSMSAPGDRQLVTTQTVQVSGTAADDIAIARIQVLANYDGTWKSIADNLPLTAQGTYSGAVDLCAAGIPDGPFGLTVRIYDREGSQASGLPVRQLVKNYACTGSQVPVASMCTPASNQVALYTAPDFRGDCQLFNVNTAGYTSTQLGLVGDNKAASIQVGSSVQAILFERSSDVTSAVVNGRTETLEKDDTSLSDNRIGASTVSGLVVQTRTTLPDEPFIRPPGNRYDGAGISSLDSVVLAWEGGAGGTSFDVQLQGPKSLTTNVTGNTLSVGNLPSGNYTLNVVAKSGGGSNTSTLPFSVMSAALPDVSATTFPYTEGFEAGGGNWTATGLWRYGNITIGKRTATNAWIFNDGTDYSDATWKSGDLTSPVITLPAGQTSYLRFYSYTDVEDGNIHWDQRRVQISADGGPFTDLWQAWDDKQIGQVWLNSPYISLQNYAGKKIRLRFHFDAVDEDLNGGAGWMIDDINIGLTGPNPDCADKDADPNAIPALSLGGTVSAVLCPEGDVDYYKFTGASGQAVLIDLDARTLIPASSLDSYVYLLDSDRSSVLAENDDEASDKRDSLLPYTLTRTGTYYLKVKAWNHPAVGGTTYNYNLMLKSQPPATPPAAIAITNPSSRDRIPNIPFSIIVTAQDFDGGQVASVDFYWHGPDWSNPAWVKLGTDPTSADGWSMAVNPVAYGAINGSALYVQAWSKTGAVRSITWWDLRADTTSPTSAMISLPAQTNSTAVKLDWTASDPNNDIDRFELQYQVNGGAWQLYTEKPLPGGLRSLWFAAPSTGTLGFRMRAIDRAGNEETFPGSAETKTTIPAACVPDSSEIQGQTLASAVKMTRKVTSGPYNLCASELSGAGDIDLFGMELTDTKKVMVFVTAYSGGPELTVKLYDATKALKATWTSGYLNGPVVGIWTPPAPGMYYLEVQSSRAGMFGTDMTYRTWFGDPNQIFTPIIGN